ncbi:ketopantoate reductase family protein [Burkholderia pseudomultivorans]|uniref:2-dehydropantoate 2-reductase n=1 Tax=Burkholderia pseudomultivorans TaxID=1207504 RepID=A0A132ET39_9BURK|nr:2-dehydropantoate 2-reductase [Burkholderia pseudomultivorans]KWF58362.1 2-dehydropantoate 2-reductase [Burkholderia pseudomultivorans]
MRIAVMGAGAVGCYFGGMLARAGHSVVLIGRPQHVEAIRRDGLYLDAVGFKGHVPLEASTEAEAVQHAELVLLSVKSTDTESAAAAMRRHLAREAVIMTLQNGVDNAPRLQAVLTQEVIATVVRVAAEMIGPGHIKHRGRGDLTIASAAKSDRIAEILVAAGVPTDISDNVTGALWAKLIGNCAYNALSAITQLPYGRIAAGDGVEDVLADVVAECLQVAAAMGVQVPGDVWLAVRNGAKAMPEQLSSTAQDLARGKRSEIDHLNGYVVRQGEALGIATPVNRALRTLVKLIESRSALPSDQASTR